MRNAFPASNSPLSEYGGFEGIRNRLLVGYEDVPTSDLLLEYEERIQIFRKSRCYSEAKILEDGKRIWYELRPKIGETRFREELIMTLAVAFHSSFVTIPRQKDSKIPGCVSAVRKRIRNASSISLEH
jgi:hypothetical protein